MATYGYSTPYTGRGDTGPLPPGYMEAATAPGRNLAMGIAAMGQGLGKAIEQYRTKKAETEAATQSWETVSGLMQQQLSSDPKYLAIQQYMETGALPQGVTEQDIPRYTQQVQADREMLNKFSALGEKFPDMSLAKKKAALGDAVMVLNQYRTDQQNQVRDAAARQQLQLGALQLGKAQREAEAAPYFTQAIGDVMAMQPGQTPTMPFANVTQEMIAKYGGRLTQDQMMTLGAALRDQEARSRLRLTEQAISQVAQLPATQEVTVPAPPAIISSSLNIPAEQQPYTPFYQVQQVMGDQQQQPDVAAFAQGLGRPVTRIPQRIPIADQPLTAAPAPVPQPPISTQRVPLRDRQVLQQQQAARPVGIAPIPQREVPAFESQPIQRTATETQPVGYQDRFKQAVDVFQRLGAPINPEVIRSVMEATGTPQPTTVEQVSDLGSVVRFGGGKEQFVPRKETNIDDMLKIKGLTIDFPEFQGTAPSAEEAKLFREQYKTVLDSRRDITRLFEIAGMGKAMQQSPKIKAEADQLARSVQGALRLDILGAGTVSEPDRKLLESIVRNPTDIFSLPSSNMKSLEGLLSRATNGITTRAQSLGLQALTPQAAQSRSSLASDPRVASIRARMNSGAITRQQAAQELQSLK